jgi:heterodisulfide reductase subunit A-like polyferredoxin
VFVCCYCGCCCGVLTTAKKFAKRAEFFQTEFLVALDREKAQICRTCVTRCQMDAIADDDGRAAVSEEWCIGCGLCVTTCPSEAMTQRASHWFDQ